MTETELLTVREAARACNRSEETIRRWIWSGRLRSRKMGNQHFIQRADLNAMLAPRTGEAKATYRASSRRSRLFDEYDYSALQVATEEHRGRILASAAEEARQIIEDEALQDEIASKYGRVDVLVLLDHRD